MAFCRAYKMVQLTAPMTNKQVRGQQLAGVCREMHSFLLCYLLREEEKFT